MVINKVMTVQVFTRIRPFTSIKIVVGKLSAFSLISLNITITG